MERDIERMAHVLHAAAVGHCWPSRGNCYGHDREARRMYEVGFRMPDEPTVNERAWLGPDMDEWIARFRKR